MRIQNTSSKKLIYILGIIICVLAITIGVFAALGWRAKNKADDDYDDLEKRLTNALTLLQKLNATTVTDIEDINNSMNLLQSIQNNIKNGIKAGQSSLIMNSVVGIDSDRKGFKIDLSWDWDVLGMIEPACNLTGSTLTEIESVDIEGSKQIPNALSQEYYKYEISCIDKDDNTNPPKSISRSTKTVIPILINDCTELSNIGDSQMSLTKEYYLGGNIDCTGNTAFPIDRNYQGFYGIINGQNYTIRNLVISNSGTDFISLIGRCYGCKVMNLKLENPNMSGKDFTGSLIGKGISAYIYNIQITGGVITGANQFVGGIVGELKSSRMECCSAEVTISASNYHNGGLIGGGSNIYISQCSTKGSISNSSTSANNAGGLIGNLGEGCIILNSYTHMNITFHNVVGGIIGNQYSTGTLLTNAYSVGVIVANYLPSPTIGQNAGPAGAKYIYWDVDVSGVGSADWGTGLTTLQMMLKDSFLGFDFDDVWYISDQGAYPVLRWQL